MAFILNEITWQRGEAAAAGQQLNYLITPSKLSLIVSEFSDTKLDFYSLLWFDLHSSLSGVLRREWTSCFCSAAWQRLGSFPESPGRKKNIFGYPANVAGSLRPIVSYEIKDCVKEISLTDAWFISPTLVCCRIFGFYVIEKTLKV